jgi:two-component system sensor histidine kinase ChvG
MTVDSKLDDALEGYREDFPKQPRRTAATAEAAATGVGRRGSDSTWRRRRPVWRSPLTRRILLLNLLVLVIPILGLMHLDQYRQSLVRSEIVAMQTQASTIALALGSAAAEDSEAGQQSLVNETVRQLLRVLVSNVGIRARVYGRDGRLIGDSRFLGAAEGDVVVEELPPPEPFQPMTSWFGYFYDQLLYGLPGDEPLPLYREVPEALAEDYPEVMKALEGEKAGGLWVDSRGRLQLSAAVPVQRYRQVLAALMVNKDGRAIDRAVRDRRQDILLVFGFAFAVTVLLSFYLARTIARPIRRLAEAAERVRGGIGKRERIVDLTGRNDEIGDLSGALMEMTESLHDRLEAIEHFAADVAHEIKNPLTSLRSAVETVARVEDPVQQKKLMSIIVDDVQRLDRLISDISDASRLDAELARSETEVVDLGDLLMTLAEVLDAAVEDDARRVVSELDDGRSLQVMGLEGRLGQVFRNLIANAMSFSPPGGTILLSAHREKRRGTNWIVVTVDDDGPGIPESKLGAIFERFYSERPKSEKFGTHSGLGLSISKQIVEAHGGSITAENRPDGGARFIVRLPAR